MSLLKKLVFLLLLAGFYSPSFAAVDDFDLGSCRVFNEDDKKEGDKKEEEEEEEEPDCE